MLYNLSISGATSETTLKTLDEAKLRLGRRQNKPIIIIQGGGNDCAYLNGKEDNYQVAPDKFRQI